jgi:hypothetical protein
MPANQNLLAQGTKDSRVGSINSFVSLFTARQELLLARFARQGLLAKAALNHDGILKDPGFADESRPHFLDAFRGRSRQPLIMGPSRRNPIARICPGIHAACLVSAERGTAAMN